MIRLAIAAAAAMLLATAPASAQVSPEWQDVIRRLRHPEADTRLEAVNRLAAAGLRAAAEPAAALLIDPDDRVQLAAIDAQLAFFLADRPERGGLFGRGGTGSLAQDAFEAGPLLRGAAPAASVVLEQLLAAVRDENARVRFDALHAFGAIAEAPLAPPLVPKLIAELDHYDPIIRAATARVIARFAVSEAADALALAVVDTNPVVRRYATEATGIIRDAKALAPLRDQFSRARGEMAAVTALAIGRIGSREDLALFRQQMGDRAPAIRRAGIEGLGRLGDQESLPAIEAVLKADRDASVRVAAACALQRFGQQQTHIIAPMLVVDDVRAQARDCLLGIGPAAIPGIAATLKVATDARHRADLVQLIGYLGSQADIATLEALAADPAMRVQRAVGHAIARLRR